jgi:hypothetical protein
MPIVFIFQEVVKKVSRLICRGYAGQQLRKGHSQDLAAKVGDAAQRNFKLLIASNLCRTVISANRLLTYPVESCSIIRTVDLVTTIRLMGALAKARVWPTRLVCALMRYG